MWFVIRSWACRLGALLLVVLGIVLPVIASAQVCAAPGVGGSTTVSAAATVLNTYYPGSSAGGTAGGTSIGYTSGSARGAATAIAAGDLVLIIQMQDGTGATTSNSSAYAFPASAAGNYEFARVLSLGAGSLNLTTGLLNSYTQNTAASSNQTYQVIRVPQYATLTISSGASVVPMPWDGGSGGVVALDVAGAFTNNGAIDASYAGFRGNAGLTLNGVSGAAALTVATLDYVRPDTYTAHGGKGEGIGGTPDRVLNVFASPGVLLTSGSTAANGNTTNLTTAATYSIATNSAYLSTTSRSYNGGSRAAGAPANAGGGGDDSSPADNSENSGGGGGGNSGAGGIGGNTWNTNIALGGRGGNASSPSLSNRLLMGGGGGSGTTNNNYGLDASGGAGGGLILVKAGTVGGGGSLLANGQAGRSIPTLSGNCPANNTSSCDGAGGGGGGGTIVVLAASGTIASAQVLGGQGGNINGTNHGPGGGGGGGLVVRSSALALSAAGLTGGAAGLMNLGGGSGTAYGATAGASGASSTIANTGLPGQAGGAPAACLPALTVAKVTATPASVGSISPPGTTTYSIIVSNAAGRGDARGLTLYDPTLPGGSVTVANPPAPSYTIGASPPACALGTRSASVDPASGATATWTASAWTLPGGCTLTYTFTVNVPATVPNGTYNNSAVAWQLDPSDSSGTRTVTAALPPAASGLTANTAFTTGGTVGGANYDGNNAANTGEDLKVQRVAQLTVTKSDGLTTVTAGSVSSYTVTIANLGPADASGTVFTDPAAAGLSCTSVSCAAVTGAASCPAAGSTTIAALQGSGISIPALPGGSSVTFLVTCGVTATGQ